MKLYFLPFPVLAAGGIIVTIVHHSRNRYSTETYLYSFLKQLWMVLGLSFILVVAISLLQQHPPFTYTLLVGGIGTLVSGMAMRFRPMVVGGILFLLLAFGSVFVSDGSKPLLQGIGVIVGYLVPGYLLKYSKLKGSADVQ